MLSTVSSRPLTPFPELDVVLEDHAQNMMSILGANFVGEYLHGSLATGDFDLSSDVDFIVVTEEDLTEQEAGGVQAAHALTYDQDNRWVKRLEYSFFPRPVLRQRSSPYTDQWTPADNRKLWYFDNGSRTMTRSDHDNTLVVRWTVREKGVTVRGASPTTLIESIPASELQREIRNTLVGWGTDLLQHPDRHKNRFYQSYLVLNFCRMLHDLREGTVDSKLTGATWAKSHLDPQWTPLIAFCWQERQDTTISVHQPADEAVYKDALRFVAYAIGEAH